MRHALLLVLLLVVACDKPAETGTLDSPEPGNATAATKTPAPAGPSGEAPIEAPQDDADDTDEGDDAAVTPPPARPQPTRPAVSVPNPAADSPRLAFETPEGWVEEKPNSRMRQAQYRLDVADGDPLSLAVFFLGGTVEQNIARWRTQFKTAEGGELSADDSPATTFEANGLPVSMVTLKGSYAAPAFMGGGTIGDATMLAAGIEGDARGNWYIRVVGPSDAVATHADRFRAFLESAKAAE